MSSSRRLILGAGYARTAGLAEQAVDAGLSLKPKSCKGYTIGDKAALAFFLTLAVACRLGFRACLGILRLARSYGSARIEAACRRAAGSQRSPAHA